MAARRTQSFNADTIRKIAALALGDAVEITVLVALLQQQNADGVNKQLNEAGAGRAAIVFRNALISRLIILIARAYPKSRKGDLHKREAARLLKMDNVARQIFGSGEGKKKLAEFEGHWSKCSGDHRLPLIKHFRDKYTAHLGEPKDGEAVKYRDLFEFGNATARAMELLALATGVAVEPINTDPDIVSSAEAFWAAWRAG